MAPDDVSAWALLHAPTRSVAACDLNLLECHFEGHGCFFEGGHNLCPTDAEPRNCLIDGKDVVRPFTGTLFFSAALRLRPLVILFWRRVCQQVLHDEIRQPIQESQAGLMISTSPFLGFGVGGMLILTMSPDWIERRCLAKLCLLQ